MEQIISIAKKIKKENGGMYLVGGAVRDEIMGIQSNDFDYCVTGITEEKFLQLFPQASKIGKGFPVFLLDKNEIALARCEKKIAKGHKGFHIESTEQVTIQQDLKRRDISINAIAKDVLTGEWIDPYGGIEDLKLKKIRHVSEAFKEDPLRVYRAARFAAKFGFYIDQATTTLMWKLKGELGTIPKERVFEELKKALATTAPSLFFRELKKAKVLEVHFQEIFNLIGVEQPITYHPEGDAFEHTMLVLDRVAKQTQDVSIRFAALVHDIGKGVTPKEILPRHIGHEEAGSILVEKMCQRLQLPKKWRKKGVETAKYHMLASICYQMRPYKLAKFFQQIERSCIGLQALEMIVNCDDMLQRKKVYFAQLACEMKQTVNGSFLLQQGITAAKIGYLKYNESLLLQQAQFLKQRVKELGYDTKKNK